MTARDLLIDASGAVRPPWRLLVFGAALVLSYIVLGGTLGPLVRRVTANPAADILVYPWVLLGTLLGAHALSLLWVEREGWKLVALGRDALRPRALVLGALLGAAAIALPSAALLAIGWLRPERTAEGSSLLAAIAIAAFLAPSAMWEELLFRGYPFAVLREWWGAPAALAVTSAAFGMVHLQNAGASVWAIAVVVLAGVFLGGVLLATRSLYAAFLAHLAWNWTLAGVLHSAVSGIPFATPDYRVIDAGPDWATGGMWGPEGGAGAALGLLSATIYLYARRMRRGEPS